MKFLVDNQLPPALARMIQSDLGSEALHVTDIGMRNASDVQVWEYASTHAKILISKDDDFLRLFLIAPTARLVWVRIGNCRRAVLLEVFRRMWPQIVERLEQHDTVIEVR